jgi:hypothetical protein
MQTIYKFRLSITDGQILMIPLSDSNQFFSVGLDPYGDLCLWCAVDSDQPESELTIRIVGTGRPMPENAGKHIGTVTMPPFVWHVFVADC